MKLRGNLLKNTFSERITEEAEFIDEEEAAESWDGRQAGDGSWEWERPLVGSGFCVKQKEEKWSQIIYLFVKITEFANMH